MKKGILFGALVALPLAASAEGLSYNYVQLDFIVDSELEAGGGSVDGDGFDLSGVFSFSDSMYVLGNYEDVSYDGPGNASVESIGVGVGLHSNAYTGAIDIYGNLTFENVDVSAFGASADESGFGLEVGARTALGTSADGYISYEYNDIDDAEANFFKLGVNFMVTQNWGITGEYRTGDYDGGLDRDDLRIGARYNF